MIKAQLAENLPPSKLPLYVPKKDWWCEQKFDGHRLLMHVTDSEAFPINRSGSLIDVPARIRSDFESGLFQGTWVFDGELLRDTYVVFDLLAVPGKLSTSDPYARRRSLLDSLMPIWQPRAVIPNSIARTEEEKRNLMRETIEHRSEGIMLKQTGSRYFPGLRTNTMLKCKFVKTADVVVTIVGREGKNSVGIAVYDGQGIEVDVGACTVTGRVLSQLSVGDVIECRYLYATDEHKLFQPAFLGIRTDKSPLECLLSQLVYTDKSVVNF